jgi:hypothetical protein
VPAAVWQPTNRTDANNNGIELAIGRMRDVLQFEAAGKLISESTPSAIIR